MKKYLISALLWTTPLFLFGQQKPTVVQTAANKRTETYQSFKYHTDSLRFTIVGQNDTVLTEDYYTTGRIEGQEWHGDSILNFDRKGVVRRKFYIAHKRNNQTASEFTYNKQGKVERITIKQGKNEERKTFTAEELSEHYQSLQLTPSVNYEIWADETGQKRGSSYENNAVFYKNDSVRMTYDSLFFPSGRLHKARWRIDQEDKSIVQHYIELDEKGKQIAPIFNDSFRLRPFKDNLNCYYGLQNRQGDTIFSPRFDHVATAGHPDLMIVQIGNRAELWRCDGKRLSQNPMEIVSCLNGESSPSDNMNAFDGSDGFQARNWNSWHNTDISNGLNHRYFNYKMGSGHGVLAADGTVILPPQYPPFYSHDKQGRFFAYAQKRSSGSWDYEHYSQIVDRSGKLLFGGKYPFVEAAQSGYFIVANKANVKDTTGFTLYGLVDSLGTEILPMQYQRIAPFSDAYWVSTGKLELDKKTKRNSYQPDKGGIFNHLTRKWILPLQFEKKEDYGISGAIIKDSRTQKYGLLDNDGQQLLPPQYDSIFSESRVKAMLTLKNGVYRFYDSNKKTLSKPYEYLLDFTVSNYPNGDDDVYFLSKNKEKWGIIDANERIILPFDYDYAAKHNYDDYVLIKDKEAYFFEETFLPNPLPKPYSVDKEASEFQDYTAIDTDARFFIVNKQTGRMVMPPQYKTKPIGRGSYNYRLLEDDKGHQKLLFKGDTTLLDYPFPNNPSAISDNHTLFLYEHDSVMHVANLQTGKTLCGTRTGGVALGSNNFDNYFMSDFDLEKHQTTQNNKFTDSYNYRLDDTLQTYDRDWLWFSADGKRLNADTFRYPMRVDNGFCVGIVGDKFGIWREDGTRFAPPQYENIRYDNHQGIFIMFQTIGLRNWVVIMDTLGKMRVKTGFYNEITRFFDAYALVRFDDKIGLIDTNGREIIAPMRIETNAVNFLDSLSFKIRKAKQQQDPNFWENIDFDFGEMPMMTYNRHNEKKQLALFDSSAFVLANRNLVFNVLLQSQLPVLMNKMRQPYYKRANATLERYHNYFGFSCGTGICYQGHPAYFAFSNQGLSYATPIIGESDYVLHFFNYRRRNNQWQVVQLGDVLNLTIDNTFKINDLLGKEIQALKNEDIDCGQSESFFRRSQNMFLLTETGIDFYFDSSKSSRKIPVKLSWAALNGFLIK